MQRQLGGRPLDVWMRELAAPRNYRALVRMARLTPRPLENAKRYLLGRGAYPYRARVRTPVGAASPELYSFHDMMTFNEVFLREDYRCSSAARVVVDIGSNIGISALYFLTRNPFLRCWLYEPVPANVTRLRHNLAGYEDRYEVSEVAVADGSGDVDFGFEPTGRYGGIGVKTASVMTVPCVDINTILARVLDQTGSIDVLKIDTEGLESSTVQAIEPRHLDAIETIYFEWRGKLELHPERFRSSYYNETYRLERRSQGAGLLDEHSD